MNVPPEHSDRGSTASTRALWTVTEVAAILAVSTPAAYALIREGRLPAVRLGRRIRVDAHALEQWIAQGGCGRTT